MWFGYLQFQAGAVPLWRDHLPELSIEVMEKGVRHEFPLVSRKKRITVDPRRGVRTPISIDAQFHLAPGFSEYRFPLVQGSQSGKLEYDAVLRSDEFPRRDDTPCELELTYEYGADDPYVLRFIPVDGSFTPIRAAWRPVSERPPVDLSRLPVPPFPSSGAWTDFRTWTGDGGTARGVRDLLGETMRAFAAVEDDVTNAFPDRVTGEFEKGKLSFQGDFVCDVLVDGERVFCRARSFAEPVDESSLSPGDPVYLVVHREASRSKAGGETLSGREVTFTSVVTDGLRAEMLRKARPPTYTIWNHGRSIDDPDCPSAFREATRSAIRNAELLLADPTTSAELRSELTALLSRLHKDAPDSVHRDLLAVALRGRGARLFDVAYGLGDCSLPWQHQALIALASSPEPDVRTLAVALWRSREPVHLLSEDLVDRLLTSISAWPSGRDESRIC